ncbi:hypothetical protein E8E14_003905 [Neopestalotiopsis sp. 37M]|nr:hypothetical protein E8E14_003905 [Neopestalotiopsis sp. 37M]
MSKGPLPSKRCLLADLPTHEVGDKVRFLGCVDSYAIQTGVLSLSHKFPSSRSVKASVDVKLLLENLRSGQTDVGQWVHVLGYITSVTKKAQDREISQTSGANVGVQALLLWSAQDLDIAAYTDSMAKTSP